jgi:hypothetical protein
MLLLALAAVSGCSHLTTRIAAPVPVQALALEGSRAPLARVLDELGAPDRIGAAPRGGFFLLYESLRARERQIGLSIPYGWLRYFKLAFGRGDAERRELVLHFDRDGLLTSRGQASQDEDLGGGLGVQLVVSVVPTVDIGHLTAAAPQHAWGRGLLTRLPEGLNRSSSLETGASGVERRGVPYGAGQHTLEQR